MKIQIEVTDDDGIIYRGDAILTRVGSGAKKYSPALAKAPGKKIKCPEAIKRLWQNGQFKTSLSFPDVKARLAGDGYNFPNNTLMMALTNAEYLTKRGGKGSYQWSQRHPYA